MTDHIISGISHGNGRVDVKGRPVTDEFEMASALYTLLSEASKNEELADGGLRGASVGEPRLTQLMSYQSENLLVTIGGRHFRITVKMERD